MCGCTIYLLFRTKTLYIYNWCVALGLSSMIDSLRYAVLDWSISDLVKYSLPDGLYCAAYILIMDAIWSEDNKVIKHAVVLLIPVITISHELFQGIGLARGTFDIYDLISYSLPPILYIVYYSSLKYNNLKIMIMKKYLLSLSVVALFAIGFTASDETETPSSVENSEASSETQPEKQPEKNPLENFIGKYTLYDNDGNKAYPYVVAEDGRFFCNYLIGGENYVKCGIIVPVSDKVFSLKLSEELYTNEVWSFSDNHQKTLHRSIPPYRTLYFDISEGKMYINENEYENRDYSKPEYFKFRFAKD